MIDYDRTYALEHLEQNENKISKGERPADSPRHAHRAMNTWPCLHSPNEGSHRL